MCGRRSFALFLAVVTCACLECAEVTIRPATGTNTSLSDPRGMKKKMMNFIPYLMVPAFALAGIMPWILPPIKAAVMFVSMINNMAFSSALFMLIRNYLFNHEKDEHIIYVNHGYRNKEKPKQR